MINIIPAIDIIDGKCVRLTQGDYNKLSEYGNPLDLALAFEDAGCKRLHLVDLDGAKASHIINYKILETLATRTQLVIDFGGGIKNDDDIRIAFNSGASIVTGGSVAVKRPEIFLSWLSKYGSDRVILGADARNGKIATDGWQKNSDYEIIDFIGEYISKGVSQTICTDISCDGTLQGPSIELYKKIIEYYPDLNVIASGGVGSMSDVEQLNDIGIRQVIVGKAIYENKITLKEIESLNVSNRYAC